MLSNDFKRGYAIGSSINSDSFIDDDGTTGDLRINSTQVWFNGYLNEQHANCVVIDSLGNVYVGYSPNSDLTTRVTLRKFDNNGNLLWEKSEFDNVRDIKIASNLDIFVVHVTTSYGMELRRLNPFDGNTIWRKAWGAPDQIQKIDLDSNDNIYCASHEKTLSKLSPIDGSVIWIYDNPCKSGRVSVADDNTIYISQAGISCAENIKLAKFNSLGERLWFTTTYSLPFLTVDSSGNYYGINAGLKKYSPDNILLWSTPFKVPSGSSSGAITIDSNGYIYVGGGWTISVFSPSGILLVQYYDYNSISGLSVDSQGYVYVSYFNTGVGIAVRKLAPLI